MVPRSLPLVLTLLQACFLQTTRSDDSASSSSPSDLICQPIQACQPCPKDQLSDPVCEIFHNRRLVECVSLADLSSSPSSRDLHHPSGSNQQAGKGPEVSDPGQIRPGPGPGRFQIWQACERVVAKEQRDFYEFVVCNLVIAIASLIVYGLRTKQLVVKQYGKLAAKIGILPS